MTPPVSEPNKVYGLHLDPQKQETQKIDFFKKPEFCNLSKHYRWVPQLPWSPKYHQTSSDNSSNLKQASGHCDTFIQIKLYVVVISKDKNKPIRAGSCDTKGVSRCWYPRAGKAETAA